MKSLALALIFVFAFSAYADHYAVLVAGSDGFWNYRHQSDICHAYHILLRNGYNPNNIITFAKDDIAHDSMNPFPGQVFNKPGTGNDVYAGCKLDYVGDDVTPENFMAVLRGDSAAVQGKRVLQSGPSDKVFLNFADHGATGLIAFPSSYLYAEDLINTFKFMKENNKYEKLVFYLEACESGSMFKDLDASLGIYAVSAASPDESSWATYCPPDDAINGVHVGSCLGDLFSVIWMEDTDGGQLGRSLQEQYTLVRDLTTASKVMQWGDLSFTNEPLSNYLSAKTGKLFLDYLASYIPKIQQTQKFTQWDSRNNKLNYLINRFKMTQSAEDFIFLQQEFKSRQFFDQKFTALQQNMNLTGTYTGNENKDCLKQQVENFIGQCGKLTDYSLKYVKYLAEMCDQSNMLQAHMVEHIKMICDE